MSNLLSIFILTLPLLCTCLTCPEITCDSLALPDCYNYNITTNTAVAGQCPENEYCEVPSYDLTLNGKCNISVIETNDNGPGQPCDANNLCINLVGVSCVDGICLGLSLNQRCWSNKQCNPGMYCKSLGGSIGQNICNYLIKAGKSCDPILDRCEYGYGCNGTCIKMFSVPEGHFINKKSCINYFSNLCRNGTCSHYSNYGTVCMNTLTNMDEYNKECVSCVGESKIENYGLQNLQFCTCSINGKSYCPGFLGDEYGLKYFKILKKFYFSNILTHPL